MRVTTAFKRLLRLPGASVADVSFGAEGVIVTVRLRRRRRVCAGCGQTGRQLEIHDRRVKRWRHLDLGASRCIIECQLRRLRCRDCGVRLEPVPWARPGAQHTRDFEDVVAWLAQQMAKTPITGLLRIGWDTVGRIVARVVADHLDERRLQGLVLIGVETVCANCESRQRDLRRVGGDASVSPVAWSAARDPVRAAVAGGAAVCVRRRIVGLDRAPGGRHRPRAGCGVDAAQSGGVGGVGRAGGGDRGRPGRRQDCEACARNGYRLMSDRDLAGLSEPQLRARRRRLAASLGRLEAMLPGSLVRQGRRCSSSGCRCRRGELHGPYLYLALYGDGRNRSVYVPAPLEAVVDGHVAATRHTEAVLAEIAQINVALLTRRALR